MSASHRSDTVRRAAFGLIASGYLALTVSAAMSTLLVPLAVLFVALAYRLRVQADPRAAARQRALRRVAVAGFLFGAFFAALDRSMLELVAAGSIWGGFGLIFSAESERNYYGSFLAALSQLVVSGGTTDSVIFALSIVLFIISGTLALAAMQLRGQRGGLSGRFGERDPGGDPHPVPVIQNGAWEAEAQLLRRLSTLVTGVIAASTIVLFFVIPRYGAGYFFSKDQTGERRAAFSDTVDFGAIGAVQQSNAIAMRVELTDHTGPFNGVLRFRGVGLGKFDGKTWRASEGHATVLADAPRGFRETTHMVNSPFYKGGSQRLTQKIFLTQDNGVLFGATRIYRIWGKLTKLVKTAEDSLTVQFPAYTSKSYRCVSDVGRPPPAQLRAISQPCTRQILETYTQLPNLDPRVRQLALQVTAGASNNYDRIVRLEQYLQAQYAYALPTNTTAPEHPVEEFLFTTKQGHCEYFAASLTVLARTLGIPARVVTGYAGGTWSPVGGYYLISDADAHSWVEVFFPAYGWLEFDATPAGALGRSAPGWRDTFYMYWDAAMMAWRRYVVDYHLLDQIEYVRSLGRFLKGESDPTALPTPGGPTPGRTLPPVVGFVLITAVVLAVLMRTLVRQVATAVTPPALGDASFYLGVLTLLERRGFARRAGQTPRELARVVALAWPAAAPTVDALTDAYHRVRHGGAPLARPEVETLVRELEAVPPPSGRA